MQLFLTYHPGIVLACGALGTATAFLVGGAFLDLYIDIGRVDIEESV